MIPWFPFNLAKIILLFSTVSWADTLSYSLGFLIHTPHVHSHSHQQQLLFRPSCQGWDVQVPLQVLLTQHLSCQVILDEHMTAHHQPQGKFCEDASKICGKIPHVPCGN